MKIVSVAIGVIRERSRRAVLAIIGGARSVTGRSAPKGNVASTERLSPGEAVAKLSPSVRRGWKQAADMRMAGIAASAVGIAVLAVAAGIWLADENREDSLDRVPNVVLSRTSPQVLTAIDVEPAAGGEETPPPADEIDVRLAAPSIERTAEAELPAWRRFAVEVVPADRTGPMIALVIDDMGAERTKEFATAEYFAVMNYRLNDRELETIVTTNMELNRMDDKIADRLLAESLVGDDAVASGNF